MNRPTIRRILVLAAALLGGGALALPFASANTTPDTTSATTETTASTATTGTTGTTAPTTTAPRPQPPTAFTAGVEQIATNSAVLKAKIDPHGAPTSYYFEYGHTVEYGSQTVLVSAGNAPTEGKFTQTVAGLAPDTIYHFRVVASNAAGSVTGADGTFTTKGIPLTLSAATSPTQVVFGRPVKIWGTLSGSGNAGVEVVAQESLFPYSLAFRPASAPQLTNAGGGFALTVDSLPSSAQLRVAVLGKSVYSPVITEPVTARVTLHLHRAGRTGRVRLTGTVTPAEPGARVAFERLSHGRYVPVAGTTIERHGGGLHFARTMRLSRGRYRAFVEVRGGGLTSGYSTPVTVR